MKKKTSPSLTAMATSLAITVLAGITGCTTLTEPSATAQLQPTKGNTAQGVVTFVSDGDHVRVNLDIRGLKPNAEHGFHIHDKGDCSSGDGLSAGPHFNPTAKPHGAHGEHGSAEHHTGDLPALKADANGAVKLSFHSKSLTIGTGVTDVVGHGLIVHRDPDDFKTQPTGNSGARIACAVITKDAAKSVY